MFRLSWPLAFCLTAPPAFGQIDGFERPPINYKTAPTDNVITALQGRIDSGKTNLPFVDDHGYLPALLKELNVPQSSQVLVFSKTSFQRERITPKTPRALYFNDDVYVGFCLRGDVLEVSAADSKLGTAFYTLDQQPEERPRFQRQLDNCLACHASSATGGAPGHLLRSVFPDRLGLPILSAGSFRTDTTSPFEERWGGWYATGTHGAARHLGNAFFTREDAEANGPPPEAGQNITDLKKFLDTSKYLSPHSDIVALMVLEHQTDMHNRLCHAALDARLAIEEQKQLNTELGEKPDHEWDSVKSRIKHDADEIVEGLLFKGEPMLTAPVKGTSGFTEEFSARHPRDKSGRSLREFDLKTRLFRYPCSYLIYSASFQALPAPVRNAALTKLHALLTSPKLPAGYESLAAADRSAIRSIIRDTLADLPPCWK